MTTSKLKIIEDLKEFLYKVKDNPELRVLFTSDTPSLTRDRKLPFDRLVLLLINMLKRSSSIEIHDFFEVIGHGAVACTKSAFCQQRMKLKDLFFDCWNTVLSHSYYKHFSENTARWRGFRVFAVDGSTAYLVNKPDVSAHFGVQSNQVSAPAMGRVMAAYDVLNGITVLNGLFPVSMGEQRIANHWVSYYEPDMLMLYDRGFASFAGIYLHLHKEQEQKFIMRCTNNFNKEVSRFTDSCKNDIVVEFTATEKGITELYKQGFIINKNTTIKVRLIKVKLKNGETETLITNLFDAKEFPLRIFKPLYFKRWGIETNYDVYKNKLQLESFSGHTVHTIMQDFHALCFVNNLQEILTKDNEGHIKKQNRPRKFEYQVNRNVAIGLMKNKIVKLFISTEPELILAQLELLFFRHLEPVRPGREYQRTNSRRRVNGKYQTITNYRRAI